MHGQKELSCGQTGQSFNTARAQWLTIVNRPGAAGHVAKWQKTGFLPRTKYLT